MLLSAATSGPQPGSLQLPHGSAGAGARVGAGTSGEQRRASEGSSVELHSIGLSQGLH